MSTTQSEANHFFTRIPRASPSQAPRSISDLLIRGRSTGILLQDLATISSSIPWLRSQRYWAEAGLHVFTSGEVPYGGTNCGEPSRKAVEMYVASLRAAEQAGCRETSSYVLELGTGCGLFAKLFLDQLRARSIAAGNRDYERTTYIVADYSKNLLEDTRRSGVFAEHEDRVRRVHLPERDWRTALAAAMPEAVGAIRAVHGNYLLDSLPFTILSHSDGRLFELRIRTRLREDLAKPGMNPPSSTDARVIEAWLADVLKSTPEAAHSALWIEAEYVPVERSSLPLPELVPSPKPAAAADSVTAHGSLQMLHGFGAIEFLDEVLGVVRPDGYFVTIDYNCQPTWNEPVAFQLYGSSLASGVNFAQLEAFARLRPDCQVGAPPEDPALLQARCFARDGAPAEVIQLFEALYSKEADELIEAPHRAAKELARGNYYEAARSKFEEAYRLQPFNWNVVHSIASFLENTLLDHQAALEVAQRGLQLNHLSSELWNLLGDCHYNLDDTAAAEQAYLQAVRLSPRNPRGHANLAYVHLRRGEPAEALRLIGHALSLDRLGDMHEELLRKQTEALRVRREHALRNVKHGMLCRTGFHALPGRVAAGRSSNGAGRVAS